MALLAIFFHEITKVRETKAIKTVFMALTETIVLKL